MQLFKKVYYGWIIVFAGMLLTALGLGMFFSTNSLFVIPICYELGLSRGEFTFHRTLITLTGAILMPLYGRLIRKIGVKKIMLICALTLSLSTIGFSFSTKLWHFYFFAVVNGLFVNGISFMSVGVLISDWFTDKQGLSIGIAYSGSGIGGAIMIPIIGSVIEQAGWQWGYRVMGLVGIIVMIPVVYFLIKNTPADMGLKPYTTESKLDKPSVATQFNFTFSEILKSTKFWLLISAFFLITSFAAATNTHTAAYLSDIGHSTIFISSIMSVFMIFLTVGKILLGILYDRLGALISNLFIAAFCIGFPIFALIARIPLFAFIYAVFIGMASCAVSISIPVLIKRYFGDKDFATIFSVFSMIATFAASISVPAMGIIFDTTGSYRLAWFIFLGTSVLLSLFLLSTELLHRKDLKSL